MPFLLNVNDIPLALYIHIPWCVKKCPYCDFNSHTLPNSRTNQIISNDMQYESFNEDYFAVYVDALIADINSQLQFIQNRQITSIFIGGGTPSLLPIKQYQRLFSHLKNVLPMSDDIEITMEANPGTLEHAPFEEYLEVGINRLSIGVQTFSNSKLKRLGRIHNSQQAMTATQAAIDAGFQRVNIDLMHGLPDQSVAEALYDIRTAYEVGASHISWYQLTIEPNTVFFRDTPLLPEEDLLADIDVAGSQLLTELGFTNYEISAWVGRNDDTCRHNINYWQFGDYLAIGAGAHGKISLLSDVIGVLSKSDLYPDLETVNLETVNSKTVNSKTVNTNNPVIYRFSKSRLPKDYMQYDNQPKMVGFKPINSEELTSEFMLNALRLTQGVSLNMYCERTGLNAEEIMPTLIMLQQKGLLKNNEKLIQTTKLGQQYLNQVLQTFI